MHRHVYPSLLGRKISSSESIFSVTSKHLRGITSFSCSTRPKNTSRRYSGGIFTLLDSFLRNAETVAPKSQEKYSSLGFWNSFFESSVKKKLYAVLFATAEIRMPTSPIPLGAFLSGLISVILPFTLPYCHGRFEPDEFVNDRNGFSRRHN